MEDESRGSGCNVPNFDSKHSDTFFSVLVFLQSRHKQIPKKHHINTVSTSHISHTHITFTRNAADHNITQSVLTRCHLSQSIVRAGKMLSITLESPHLRDLAESLPTVLASQVAPRSAAKYASAEERWEKWAGEHGLQSIPADSFQLSLYLTELMQVSRSPAPVLAAVYGVAWAHKAAGVPDPMQESTVQKVVCVARRVLARTPVRKKPLHREDIKALFVHLKGSVERSLLPSAIFLIFRRKTCLESLKITSARCFSMKCQRKDSKKAKEHSQFRGVLGAGVQPRSTVQHFMSVSDVEKRPSSQFFSRLWGVIWRGKAFRDQQCQFLTRNKSLSSENESNCSTTSECVSTDSIFPWGVGHEHGRCKRSIFSLSIFGIVVERISF